MSPESVLLQRTILLGCFCAASAGGVPPVVADDSPSVMLTRNVPPGETYYVEMNDDMETFSRGGFFGEEGVTRRSSRLRTVRRSVAELPTKKGTRVSLTFDRVAMFTETAEAPVTFDSDADDPTDELDLLAAALGPMLGKTLEFDVDRQGKVLHSRGMDQVYAAVEEAAAGGMVFVKLEEELTDARGRFYWNDTHSVLYPNKRVRVGDEWTAATIQPSIYQPNILREYQCKVEFIGERDGARIAEISYRVKMRESDDRQSKARMFGMLMSFKDGHAEGTATFDIKRGEFVAQTEDVLMNLVGVADGKKPGTTVDVSSRIKTTHSMSVVTESQRRKQRQAADRD